MSEDKAKKSVFETLYAVDLSSKVEKKNNKNALTYVPWPVAWAEVKKRYPSATYRIFENQETHEPYIFRKGLGYMVRTWVSIEGEELSMWLPVMDSANKSMMDEPYQYKVKGFNGGPDKVKTCQAASMFDINKTIMRCLVKNLAMFGLAIYIYMKDDAPEVESAPELEVPAKPTKGEEDTREKLTVKGDKWKSAEQFIIANKDLDFDEVVKKIEVKYKVVATVKRKMKTVWDNAQKSEE